MREGTNPAAHAPDLAPHGAMRAIVPVHVPDHTGYHRRALEVLRISLDSLAATSSDDVAVTVVANGCADDVVAELLERLQRGSIDQVVVNAVNRGKVDAVLGAARSASEEHLLITDADVLFRPGWQAAALDVLGAFPECGFLGLSPAPQLAWYETSATVLGAIAGRVLARGPVVDVRDLERFAASVGSPMLVDGHRTQQLHVRRGGACAVVGAGHFCFVTTRRALRGAPTDPSCSAAVGTEQRWIDAPVDEVGWWRLSTVAAVVVHMGNVPEPWMQVEDGAALLPSGGWRASAARRPPRSLPLAIRRPAARLARRALAGRGAALLLR